jgi:gliding motility-associated-like protein
MLCKTSQTINLSNNSTSPLITSYYWEFSNSDGATIFTSSSASASYTFPDTGLYHVKLVINRQQQCSDSATSVVRVYPGFKPDFNYRGICFNKPTQFLDATTSVYGTVNTWRWDLGETSAANDVSDLRNPTYIYPSMGQKNVRLIVMDSKGCRDTVTRVLTVMDKPPLSVRFRDTLICVPDAVQLEAIGNGIFSWTPGAAITNANTSTPTVNPVATTTYVVKLDDNGCLNTDSVRVRVVDHVTLTAMNDTVICRGDTIRLRVNSDGLQYVWTPTPEVVFPAVANPLAVTYNNTTYNVTARIGSCSASDQVLVTAIPYPSVNAGPDTVICFETFVQLHGSTDGNAFAWLPSPTLSDISSMDPVANPTATTSYVLSATDSRGCPKPGYDTVSVMVLPDIQAYAGHDTAVVVGQPLQMNATGGVRYEWSPTGGLSDPFVANPSIIFRESTAGVRYKVLVYNEAGCVDSAFVRVKVFETMPSIFVPNAFTPNGDGRNDVLRPIAAGMQRIEFFQVYNRWGQMVYNSPDSERGWDGTVGGKQQQPGAYVWVVKAVDYTGTPYVQRGVAMLIR